MKLISLDLKSGKKRWEDRFPDFSLSATQVLTDDGGLAMITSGGDLVVKSLGTGQVRWTVAHTAAYCESGR
jgi:outer membrane protein assembly factor BamB